MIAAVEVMQLITAALWAPDVVSCCNGNPHHSFANFCGRVGSEPTG